MACASIQNINSANLIRQPHHKPAVLNPQCLEILFSITSLVKNHLTSSFYLNFSVSIYFNYNGLSAGRTRVKRMYLNYVA